LKESDVVLEINDDGVGRVVSEVRGAVSGQNLAGGQFGFTIDGDIEGVSIDLAAGFVNRGDDGVGLKVSGRGLKLAGAHFMNE